MVGEEFKFVQRPASHLRAINLIHCELYQMPAFEYGVRGFITKSQLPAFKPTRVPATSGAGRWTAQSERRRAPPRRAWPGCAAPRRGAFLLAPRRASLALRGAIQRLRRELSAQPLDSLTNSSTFSLVHVLPPSCRRRSKTLFKPRRDSTRHWRNTSCNTR